MRRPPVKQPLPLKERLTRNERHDRYAYRSLAAFSILFFVFAIALGVSRCSQYSSSELVMVEVISQHQGQDSGFLGNGPTYWFHRVRYGGYLWNYKASVPHEVGSEIQLRLLPAAFLSSERMRKP